MSTSLAVNDLAIEHELAQVAERFRFVLDVTPTDVEENREKFLVGEIGDPRFTYRELEDDLDVVGATLAAIDVDGLEDVTLGHLLRAKRRELELQLEMLSVRDTSRFLPLSIELYGAVDSGLLERAKTILEQVAAPAGGAEGHVNADRFAEIAEVELAHYRLIEPDIGAHIQVRPDVTGVMVSGLDLLIGTATNVHASRVYALLQHEVGTHLLTHINGSYQPIKMMATGLAGYEETQEGLAVFAEFLVGGLSPFRLRQLAARVIAVDAMIADERFADVHHLLVDADFSPHSAFTTTMRVFRCGGFTKDAIYLRGVLNLLAHLAGGGTLDHLWLGKVSLQDLPLVDEFVQRGVLCGPKLLPRYLDDPATASRLERAAGLNDLSQLIEGIP